MNERITKQIEEMKKQTIGVEVEMNNIRRDKAAELAAAFSEQEDLKTRLPETDIIHGPHGMQAEGNGNSRRTSALRDQMIKNASWSHRSFTTKTSNFFRNL